MLSHRILILILLLSSITAFSYCNKPVISFEINPVSCNGKADGSLKISVKNLTEPGLLRIILQTNNDTTYHSITADSEVELKYLKAGVINLDLMLNSKLVTGTHALIIEPDPLSGGKIKVDKIPSGGSTYDGIITAGAKGGNPPYTYLWSENAGAITEASVSNLCMGIYRCKINDSNNCGPVYISIPLIKNALKNITE